MSDVEITSVRIDTGKVELNCLLAGDEHAEPLLLLHGGGLTGYTWARVLPRFAASYRCVMPELRGHGDSDWSPDRRYPLRAYAEDIAALIASLEIEPPVIVGMSLGGQVALQLSVDGHLPRGLALIDVGPTTEPSGGTEIRAFLRVPNYPSFEDAVEAAHRLNPNRPLASLRESLARNLVAEPGGGFRWKWDPRRHESFDERREEAERLWSSLARVVCPVLVVRGERSEVFPEALAARTAAAFPDARLVTVKNAGHTVQGDNPEGLADALESFIHEVLDGAR